MTKLIFQFSPDCFLPPPGQVRCLLKCTKNFIWITSEEFEEQIAKVWLSLVPFLCSALVVSVLFCCVKLSVTHKLHTYAGHAAFKKFKLQKTHSCLNRWLPCRDYIYENVLKKLSLNLCRPRGQYKTYAFCTSIWLCCLTVLLKKSLSFHRDAALRLDYC